MGNKNEMERRDDACEHAGGGSVIDDHVSVPADNDLQLKDADLIMPGVLMSAGLVSFVILASLSTAGCASTPSYIPAGPQQKTGVVIANPHCIASCTVEVSQSATDDGEPKP